MTSLLLSRDQEIDHKVHMGVYEVHLPEINETSGDLHHMRRLNVPMSSSQAAGAGIKPVLAKKARKSIHRF